MMETLRSGLRSIFTPPRVEAEAGWRPFLVQRLLAGALVIGLLALLPTVASASGWAAAAAIGVAYLLLGGFVVLRAPYLLQLVGLLLIIYALGVAELFTSGNPAHPIFYFIVGIVFATMIWSLLAGAISTIVTLLTLGVAGFLLLFGSLGLNPALTMPGTLGDWVRNILAVLLAAIAIMAAFQQLQAEFGRTEKRALDARAALEDERRSLEDRVDSRTLQWRTVLEVSRAAGGMRDPEQLTAEIVNLISDRFGYYYAAIFLLDEAGERAVLHNATGEAGRILKQNRHSLPVGGRSMVGTAVSGRQPRVALDTGAEAVRFDNPLLPYTRSEIALPLIIGERVLGALDVQSTSAGAFGPPEIETLQGMASQVAIAFENARLFQEAQRSLDELRAIQRQYVVSAWEPLTARGDIQYSLGEQDLPPQSPQIEVPLSLRDQIIGEIDLASETDWTAEQRSLVEAIATQAALALENARLVETTQSTAQRERLLAEITGKVWSSPTRDGVLRTALSELGVALGATRGTIEIATDDADE
jgi:GAF domain-containing protein